MKIIIQEIFLLETGNKKSRRLKKHRLKVYAMKTSCVYSLEFIPQNKLMSIETIIKTA